MEFKELQDQIYKWQNELAEGEKIILTHASKLDSWDAMLIKNGLELEETSQSVDELDGDQRRLQQELDFVRVQQQELEKLLGPLEDQVQELQDEAGASPDTENTYQMTAQVEEELSTLAENIKQLVTQLNSASVTKSHSKLEQLAAILSTHLDSLQWVEEQTGALKQRLSELSHATNLSLLHNKT